jgi:hypothetical protein
MPELSSGLQISFSVSEACEAMLLLSEGRSLPKWFIILHIDSCPGRARREFFLLDK